MRSDDPQGSGCTSSEHAWHGGHNVDSGPGGYQCHSATISIERGLHQMTTTDASTANFMVELMLSVYATYPLSVSHHMHTSILTDPIQHKRIVIDHDKFLQRETV